jgi:PKD repeat protein
MSKIVIAAVAAALALVLGVTQARAVIVDAAPTWPIPEDAPPAPPPIPDLPAATGSTPPAEVIADPLEPVGECSAWYLQRDYGAQWPAGSTWWEFQCAYSDSEYHNTCTGPACEAFCPSCWWETKAWTDYFFWDGTDAVFYGEAYSVSYEYDSGESYFSAHWWDAPTAQWYEGSEPANASPTASFTYACSAGDCSFDGRASDDSDGTVQSYYWDFGDGSSAAGVTAAHTYLRSGSYTVTLTATDDDDTSGSSSTVVTVEVPNVPPVARFVSSCAGPTCDFDAAAAADSDGTIVAYAWDFGDGSSGTGKLVQHTYAHAGTYSVSLTVTDDAGATATVTETVLVLGLTASGYKVKGLRKVDLSWNGPSSESFDVYRDGVVIATVSGGAYTDTVGRSGGSYVYEVCAQTIDTCSNGVFVTV